MAKKPKVGRPDIEEMEQSEQQSETIDLSVEKVKTDLSGSEQEWMTPGSVDETTEPKPPGARVIGPTLFEIMEEPAVQKAVAEVVQQHQGSKAKSQTLEEIMGAPDGDPELPRVNTPDNKPLAVDTTWMTKPERDVVESEAHQKLLNQIRLLQPRVRSDDDPISVLQAVIDGKWSRKVMMLTPFNRPINPHAHFAMMAHIRKCSWLGYDYETDTVIQRARNLLADRFLASEADWSWWVDQDTVAPFDGSAGLFHRRFGVQPGKYKQEDFNQNSLQTLLTSGKSIVGGVYAQRKPNGILVIQPDIHPRGDPDKELVKKLRTKGPFNSLVEVGYVATGCALVHRSVYEAIKVKFPELAPKTDKEPWNFFGKDVESSGEDIHFCKLAAQAGHQSHLHTGVTCAHLGEYAYMP